MQAPLRNSITLTRSTAPADRSWSWSPQSIHAAMLLHPRLDLLKAFSIHASGPAVCTAASPGVPEHVLALDVVIKRVEAISGFAFALAYNALWSFRTLLGVASLMSISALLLFAALPLK